MEVTNDLLFQVGLTLIKGVGDVTAKNLVAYCGSAEAIFKEKKARLLKIPGIAGKTAELILSEITNPTLLKRAEDEVRFIENNKITPLFYTNEAYPQRLKYCSDGPILVYFKGDANLNTAKIISVVGTRLPSAYGKQMVEEFIMELKNTGIMVVSGLAYGIDVLAHKTALENSLDTVGVLAHGLDRVYPSVHDAIANKMLKHGGLLTDYISGTSPDRENFPKRNRIVAGMCDALIIIESKIKGGSLITAEIANSYSKDVFAFPGRSNDEFSSGCNGFIKRNKAALIENAADLLFAMGWDDVVKDNSKPKTTQLPLFISLTEKEQGVVTLLKDTTGIHIDDICHTMQLTMSEAAGLLLKLEFSNIVKSRPGKIYVLN